MIRRNLTLFKIDNFLSGFWPLSAVAIIYFETITHSYTEAIADYASARIAIFLLIFMRIAVAFGYKRILGK